MCMAHPHAGIGSGELASPRNPNRGTHGCGEITTTTSGPTCERKVCLYHALRFLARATVRCFRDGDARRTVQVNFPERLQQRHLRTDVRIGHVIRGTGGVNRPRT